MLSCRSPVLAKRIVRISSADVVSRVRNILALFGEKETYGTELSALHADVRAERLLDRHSAPFYSRLAGLRGRVRQQCWVLVAARDRAEPRKEAGFFVAYKIIPLVRELDIVPAGFVLLVEIPKDELARRNTVDLVAEGSGLLVELAERLVYVFVRLALLWPVYRWRIRNPAVRLCGNVRGP